MSIHLRLSIHALTYACSSSCAITYYLARHPQVQQKLQKELDNALANDDEPASNWETVKRLPYLEAVINESLRIHSTSAIGLPRLVPEGGLHVCGKFFPEGTVLSVPSYTIHRNKEVWGDDAESFRPERWFEMNPTAIQKTFNPFSFGPRACVGRNLASMELLIIISSILRRYEFVLEDPEKPVSLYYASLARVSADIPFFLSRSSLQLRVSCASLWNAKSALSAGMCFDRIILEMHVMRCILFESML